MSRSEAQPKVQRDVPENLPVESPARRGWIPRVLPGKKSARRGIEAGVEIEHAITINRSIVDLYSAWRDFSNLPLAMKHVETIVPVGPGRTHWVVKGPLGRRLEWDAEITFEKTNEHIAWHSLKGGDLESSGAVLFKRAPGARGTELRVKMKYDPPGGKLGSGLATLFGENPEALIREDLRRFKQLMETGEIPSVEGQPRGV